MITVLIYGCLWWSQNPDDKEIGYSNVLTCLHPYKENRCNDLQPIACAIRLDSLLSHFIKTRKLCNSQLCFVICQCILFEIKLSFILVKLFPGSRPCQTHRSHLKLPCTPALASGLVDRKLLLIPDISRHFGSECPCYCWVGLGWGVLWLKAA